MSYVARAQKEDLLKLTLKLGIEICENPTYMDFKRSITSHKDYDEEFTKELLTSVIEERRRTEEEARKKEEQEEDRKRKEDLEEKRRKEDLEEKRRKDDLEEKRRKEQQDLEEKRRKEDLEETRRKDELEERKRKQEMEFELEKLRIEGVRNNSQVSSTNENGGPKKLEIQSLMRRFDPNQCDIGLYLILFERQISRIEKNKTFWVSYLIVLLPQDIVQIIARESEEVASDYDHVKNLLLKRYKMTPEKFRQLFYSHSRKIAQTWSDFSYDIQNYFQEWLSGLEISTFEELSDLIVTEQIKRKVPFEMKNHFIDEWSQIKTSKDLVKRLDDYENVRADFKKKDFHASSKESVSNWKAKTPFEKDKDVKPGYEKKEDSKNENKYNEAFERRKKPECYECGSTQHLRPQCPKLKKKDVAPEIVSSIVGLSDDEFLSQCIFDGVVNGVKMSILRDSGSTIDLICRNQVRSQDFTGDHIFVQQPLDVEPVRLPLAKVSLEGTFGRISTVAAVIRKELGKCGYLLGNRTAAKLEKLQKSNHFNPDEKMRTIPSKGREEIKDLYKHSEKKVEKSKGKVDEEKKEDCRIKVEKKKASDEKLRKSNDFCRIQKKIDKIKFNRNTEEFPKVKKKVKEEENEVKADTDSRDAVVVKKILSLLYEHWMDPPEYCEQCNASSNHKNVKI